jgi:hypothetical protein
MTADEARLGFAFRILAYRLFSKNGSNEKTLHSKSEFILRSNVSLSLTPKPNTTQSFRFGCRVRSKLKICSNNKYSKFNIQVRGELSATRQTRLRRFSTANRWLFLWPSRHRLSFFGLDNYSAESRAFIHVSCWVRVCSLCFSISFLLATETRN